MNKIIIQMEYSRHFDASFPSLLQAYYKSKGSRPSTRPKDIHEALEDYMDTLIAKTQSYRSQAEEYRNNCIQGGN